MWDFLVFLFQYWGLIAGVFGAPFGGIMLLTGNRFWGWAVLIVAGVLITGWGLFTLRDLYVSAIARADKAEAQLAIVTDERDFCRASLQQTATEVETANANALEAADACKATLLFVERAGRNAVAVRSSAGDGSAAYVGGLCGRPEAADEPACRNRKNTR